MNRKERVRRAIAHQEPDRVPKGELAIEHDFAVNLVGEELPERELIHRTHEMLNMDLWVCGDWPRPKVDETDEGYAIVRDSWGRLLVDNGVSQETIETPIKSIDLAHEYRAPTLDDITGGDMAWVVANTDFFSVGLVNSVFEDVYNLIGFNEYLMVLATEPERLRYLAQLCAEYEVAKASRFLDLGADMIVIVEDIAHNTGTFISPLALRSEIFPYMTWQVEHIKRHRDVPVLFHSDGDLNTVLDDIVSCGYDGLQSLQPSANMDIARIKAAYGDRLCLMGNIDINYVLPFGSTQEVRDAVRDTIRVAAPGGGYILSTCNTLIRAIPPENGLAMYRACDEFGTYPLAR